MHPVLAVNKVSGRWPVALKAAIVVAGPVFVVAAIACGALKVGPPGSYFFVLVAGVGAYMTQHGQPPTRVIAMTALGGLLAVVVGLLDLTWAPRGPGTPIPGRGHRRAGHIRTGRGRRAGRGPGAGLAVAAPRLDDRAGRGQRAARPPHRRAVGRPAAVAVAL
ncbi:hypothetical protein ACPCG0_12400 [Propionibacteriaceae bacterium Y1923]|uniref:hypothetical protein n=1 Tax=Aestuariimicrobium sp. Y1814 TaxID=3418742 RepID=UPI003C26A5C6